ncbi:hypothetical protein [Mycoplasma nasistruthionis]|uniref:Uncharacterized protein n=1 Tax=Mycoplasma nasistruthionis TaxID=353852 RepID=A0A4Y6I651_9MOLU|nr:hypothetical protein FIV53_01670 [Mycoplasma nasistruthionis]
MLDDANTKFKQIQQATENSIEQIKQNVFHDNRIVPYITKDELEKTEQDFNSLSLEDKKQVLMNLIDKNKLYVNYSDINDQNYQISESDKKFTDSFYKGR